MRGMGKIMGGAGTLPRDCWISDVSDGGARLHDAVALDHEVVLGTSTLRRIGRHVGQAVTVTVVGGHRLRDRIVGRVSLEKIKDYEGSVIVEPFVLDKNLTNVAFAVSKLSGVWPDATVSVEVSINSALIVTWP